MKLFYEVLYVLLPMSLRIGQKIYLVIAYIASGKVKRQIVLNSFVRVITPEPGVSCFKNMGLDGVCTTGKSLPLKEA